MINGMKITAKKYRNFTWFTISVLENEGCIILWGFFIQNEKIIEQRRLDIVCIEKIAKSCLIIDITIPGDQSIIVKEQEKINNYQDLWKELGKLWKAVPVVVGALGTISHNLRFYLKKIDVSIVTSCLQKTWNCLHPKKSA